MGNILINVVKNAIPISVVTNAIKNAITKTYIAVITTIKLINSPKNEPISCSVWNTNHKDFVYPELQIPLFSDKEDIGITMPGGGVRSCAYSLGVLRALYKFNVLQKTRYIACVSGSSWLAAVYSYQNIYTDAELLGEYIPPTELTLDKLSNIPTTNEFSNVLHDFSIITDITLNIAVTKIVSVVENCVAVTNKTDDLLSRSFGDAFFAKYGLNDFVTVPTMKDKTQSKYQYVQELRPDVPYPIILGTAISEATSDKIGIEFTPLYYGMVNSKLDGSGIYIEPTGFLAFTKNDVALTDVPKYEFNTDVAACTNNVISILKSSVISSNYEPLLINSSNTIYDLFELPQMTFFEQDIRLADGVVNGDNNGITCMLKRRVKNIIYICSFKSSDDSNLDNRHFIENNTDILYMFQESNELQLFKSSYYPELIKAFNNLIDGKKPLVVKMDMEVVSNTKYGIIIKEDEKYTPTIIFIHPSRSEWLDLIPNDSKDYIDSDTSTLKSKLSYLSATNATFINYPFTSFFHLNMSTEYIVAMSQNASYDVISNSTLFEF
jgi:hypothetical protein